MPTENKPTVRMERLDASREDFSDAIKRLRAKLSPDGSVVSPRGRELTQKVFGAALSPSEVVHRICSDVKANGSEAVVRYARALDNPTVTAESLRVPLDMLETAHKNASLPFLDSVRRIRDNISVFQSSILHK